MIMRVKYSMVFDISKNLIMKQFNWFIILTLSFFLISGSYAQEKSLENFYNQFPDPYTKSLESILIQGDVRDVVVEEDEIIFKQEEKVQEVELTKEIEPVETNVDTTDKKMEESLNKEQKPFEEKQKSALDIIADAIESQNNNNVEVQNETSQEILSTQKKDKTLVPSNNLFDFEIVDRNKFIEENLSSDISKFIIIAIAMKSTPELDYNYIVKKGDTLSSIATKFDLTLEELIIANPNIVPNKMKAGSTVNIFSPSVVYTNKVLKDSSMSSEDISGFEHGSYWIELSSDLSKKAIEEKISYYRSNFEDIFYGKTMRVRPRNEPLYVIEVGPYTKSQEADDVVSILNYRFQYAKKNKVMEIDFKSSNNDLSEFTSNSTDNRRGKSMALVTTPSGNIIKVFEGDHLGNDDARIVKILPDKIILSKLGSEVNLYFSKSRRVVLENNDGFRDNILADEYFDPPLIANKPETSDEQDVSSLYLEDTYYTQVSDEVLNADVCVGGSIVSGEPVYYNSDKGCLDPSLETPMATKMYSTNEDGEMVEGMPNITTLEDLDPSVYVYDVATNTFNSSLGTISLDVDEEVDAQFDENIRLSTLGDYLPKTPTVEPVDIETLLQENPYEVVSETTRTTEFDMDTYVSQGGDVSEFTDMGLEYDEELQGFNATSPEEFLENVSCSYFDDQEGCEATKREYGIE